MTAPFPASAPPAAAAPPPGSGRGCWCSAPSAWATC